ncbi:hypothetical protein ACWWUV_14555, partial [Corynebacterium striatum]
SSFFSIASILALSAGSRRATVVILVRLLMQVGNPHTNHQTLSQDKLGEDKANQIKHGRDKLDDQIGNAGA